MAESNRTSLLVVVVFAVVFVVVAAGFLIARVVLPETQRAHVPIAADATHTHDGSAWLTVQRGSGPSASEGDVLRFEWQPLSKTEAASMTPSVREMSRRELSDQQVWPILASMRRGETRRVWLTRNLWYGSRIEAFDVSLVSVKSKGRELADGMSAAAD